MRGPYQNKVPFCIWQYATFSAAFVHMLRHYLILKYLLIVFIFSALLTPALPSNPVSAHDRFSVLAVSIEKSLPAGWSIDGMTYQYDNATLYTYIDGAADIFLKHGFRHLTGAVCKSPKQPADTIMIDIYNMGNQSNAAKIYNLKKSGSSLRIEGTSGACSGTGYLCLYRKKYYVELQDGQIQKPSFDILQSIAKRLAEHLP